MFNFIHKTVHKTKEKIEMKLIAWLIERVCKNWITTVLGVLLAFVGIVAAVYNLIPSTLVWQGHNVANTLLEAASVALALAGMIAKDKNIGINSPTLPTKVGIILLVLSAGMLLPATARAQDAANLPSNLYAVGASYNSGDDHPVAGTALYAKLASGDTNTWAFTALDILPTSTKPFTVSTNISAGIAQKVLEFNGISFYTPTSAGISITGSNTGWSWTSGVLADYTVKKAGNNTAYHVMPNVRWIKSSVSNGSDYQLTAGLLFGWGK